MYTNCEHIDVQKAIDANLDYLNEPNGTKVRHKYPTRTLDRVSVPRNKARLNECRLGNTYNDQDNVEIKFKTIKQVNKYANEHSYMFVGKELRRYFLGIPMGDPLSVAQASALCQHAEMECDIKREETNGDSERNLSFCFMDDLNIRIAYNDEESTSKESAREYIESIKKCYPTSLNLE